METNDKKGMARREFLKRLGVGTAATAAALTGCDLRRNAATGDRTAQGEIPTDRMTYRINPKTGEKVSLLGPPSAAAAQATAPTRLTRRRSTGWSTSPSPTA